MAEQHDTYALAFKLVGRAHKLGVSLASAESCTGGQIPAAITSVAGSSAVFLGGVVAYANAVKQAQLGVPEELLIEYGAVSAEVVLAMAEGVRMRMGADYAVSTTGIAGPGGATAEKPVGLVFIGLAAPHGDSFEQHYFKGDRGQVQLQATQRALELLIQALSRERE